MKLALPIIASLLISGCSSTFHDDNTRLYDTYQDLKKEIINEDIESNREKYFTFEYLKEVSVDDNNSTFVLKLVDYMNKEINHFQSLHKNTGCLTINGTDESKQPLVLYIEYRKINGQWKVNYMFLNFIENNMGFEKTGVCPRDAEKIVLERMQHQLDKELDTGAGV